MEVEWWVSAFDARPLRGARLAWRLEEGNRALATGELPSFEAESGDVKPIGKSRLQAPALAKPVKLKVVAELIEGTSTPPHSNSWDVWVFPRRTAAPDAGQGLGATPRVYRTVKDKYPGLIEVGAPGGTAAELLLAERLDRTAAEALEQGRTVLLLDLPGVAPGVQLGWWAFSGQAGTAIAAHRAFGNLPHEGYMDELWFRLLGRTISPADESLRGIEPLMVGRGSAGYLAHVFQAKAGRGKLLASGLNLLSGQPEAEWLLDQFIRYARSPQFQPRGTFDPRNPWKAWKEL